MWKDGRVRLKAHDSKSCRQFTLSRGFKSHSFRHSTHFVRSWPWPLRSFESNVLSKQSESKYNNFMHYVYIIRNSQNKLYIGQTTDVKSRIKRHNSGQASRFAMQNTSDFKIVYEEEYRTQAEAMKREKQLKGWKRVKKEALIAGDIELLKNL